MSVNKLILNEFELYSKAAINTENCSLKKIILDKNSDHQISNTRDCVNLDFIYARQNQIVLDLFKSWISDNPQFVRATAQYNSCACLDVGSQHNFVTLLATWANFIIADPSLNSKDKNSGVTMDGIGVNWKSIEAQELSTYFSNNQFGWISSLHAIEHFGLGRYGDTLDVLGDVKGLKEIHNVLHKSGIFVGSVPVTSVKNERIIFNRNRIYSTKTIMNMLSAAGFKIIYDIIVIASSGHLINQHTQAQITALDVNTFNKANEQIFDNLDIEKIPDALYIWAAIK